MNRLYIDFEVYSELDIKEVGAERYLRHTSTRPLCKSFSLNGKPASLWVNEWCHSDGPPISDRVIDYLRSVHELFGQTLYSGLAPDVREALCDPDLKVYAHNVLFDFRVWNYLCVPLFGWPPLRLEQMEDTMAICQYMALPASLGKAGEALGVEVQKTAGTRLINLTCSPQQVKERRDTGELKPYMHGLIEQAFEEWTARYPDATEAEKLEVHKELVSELNPYDQGPVKAPKKSFVIGQRKPDLFDDRDTKNFIELFKYCIRDTDSLVALHNALPCKQLPPREREIWLMTAEINLAGLPVRRKEIEAINNRLDIFQKEKKDELLKLTDGKLYSGAQYTAIRGYCASLGYPIESCQGSYLEEIIDDPAMPEHIRSVLSIVLVLGKSSTAKYRKIQDHMVPCEIHGDYVVRDTICYHGASTGRWSGRGIQPQNFPSAVTKTPEEDMDLFLHDSYIKNPVSLSKSLLRASIVAPQGYELIAADYSAIENVVLAWIAGDEASLDDFRAGRKQYITMATAVFGGTYDALKTAIAMEDEEALLRYKVGKALVLGCGYGMGAKKFRETASAIFKLNLTEQEAKDYVGMYREHYHLNVGCWYGLQEAAIKATLTGKPQSYRMIEYRRASYNNTPWLICVLPNGKKLFYMNPRVEQRSVPGFAEWGRRPTLTYMGFNSVSRKWERSSLIPGRAAENVVQAVSREVMADGMLNVKERMSGRVELRGTVHDEAIALCKEGSQGLLEEVIEHLCDIPWAVGCPIKAAGYVAKRYKKQ